MPHIMCGLHVYCANQRGPLASIQHLCCWYWKEKEIRSHISLVNTAIQLGWNIYHSHHTISHCPLVFCDPLERKSTGSWSVNVVAKNSNLNYYVTSYCLNINSCPLGLFTTWARIKATAKTEKEKASNQNERHCIAKVQTSFSNLTGNVISHSTMSNLAS